MVYVSILPPFALSQVTYSPQLRTHDAGVFGLGSIMSLAKVNFTSPLVIPPGKPAFDFLNYCPTACIRSGLPVDGARIIYAHLHGHNLLRSGEIQVSFGETTVMG